MVCCPIGMLQGLTLTAVSAPVRPECNEPDAGKAADSECRKSFSSWGSDSEEIPPNVTLPTYQSLEGNEDGDGLATCSPGVLVDLLWQP